MFFSGLILFWAFNGTSELLWKLEWDLQVENTTSGLFTNMNLNPSVRWSFWDQQQIRVSLDGKRPEATCPPHVCHSAVLDMHSRKGLPCHPNMGRAVMAVRKLLQWEHTAEYKPGIVSKRDKFRPNLLQNKFPIKHTQSVLIHPWSHVTTTVIFFTPAETPREESIWNACGAY